MDKEKSKEQLAAIELALGEVVFRKDLGRPETVVRILTDMKLNCEICIKQINRRNN